MRRGTKIGWILVALSIMLTVWVLMGQDTNADKTEGDFTLSDDGTTLIAYNGSNSSVTVPSGVTSIAANAFYGKSNLTSVNIGSATPNMNSFAECSNLTSISASGGTYTSIDGCLYSAGGSTLCLVPEGKTSVTIPSSCKTIAGGAFSRCSKIQSLTVPQEVSLQSGATSGSGISTIYGYTGSEAETYAAANGLEFISIGGSSSSDSSDNSDDSGDDSGDDSSDDDDSSSGSASTKGSTGSGSGGSSGGSSTAGGRSGGGGGHTLDSTPKTADGDIDIRYIFCLALLLAGVGLIIYTRQQNELYMVASSRDRYDELD